MSAQKWLTAAGALLVVEAGQFLVLLMVADALDPGFAIARDTISVHGIRSSTAAIFNGSLMAVGALNVAAAFLYWGGGARLRTVVVFIVAGVSAFAVGLVTMEANPRLHDVLALAAFVGFNLMPIVVARHLSGMLRLLSYGLGVAGCVALVLLLAGISGLDGAFGSIGIGGTERLIVTLPSFWMLMFGGYLLSGRG